MINYPEVRLILADGTQQGVVSIDEARKLAEVAGLDLVEVSAAAKPPVCRIMDYGKFRFEKQKKEKEAKKKQRAHQVEIKEIKFRPKIEDHDYGVKIKAVRKFLGEGNKVKIVIRFRGREMMFQSQGLELINKVMEDVSDLGVMDKKPESMGRQQIVIISPKQS